MAVVKGIKLRLGDEDDNLDDEDEEEEEEEEQATGTAQKVEVEDDGKTCAGIEYPDNFIFDQGNTNMSCACAFCSYRYLQEQLKGQSLIDQVFSPTFTYGNRDDGHDYEGMQIKYCLEKAKEDGALPIELLSGFYTYKECKKKVADDKDKFLKVSRNFRITRYYKCKGTKEIQKAIKTTGGAMAGIYVLPAFKTPLSTGVIQYKPPKDKKEEKKEKEKLAKCKTHAILLVGWITIKEKVYWKVLNSWGTKWGVNGYGFLPEDYPFVDNTAYACVDNVIKVKWETYQKQMEKDFGLDDNSKDKAESTLT